MRTRHLLAIAGLATCTLVAGCASAQAAGTVAPSEQGNRLAAQVEAGRLLALAPTPKGAVAVAHAPGPVAGGSFMGTPGVTSLIDKTEYWTVPASLASVSAWLAAHRPPGLSRSGSTTGPAGTGTSYSAKAAEAWQSAELDVSVASLGPDRSAVRLDALVVWLDPTPVVDNAPGPRLRVTVDGGCPASDSGKVGVSNPGADLTTSLVPRARPGGALVCTFGPGTEVNPGGVMVPAGPAAPNTGAQGGPGIVMGPGPVIPAAEAGKLARHARLGPAAAEKLATDVRALSLSHALGAQYHCPMDNGSTAVVAFSYPGRSDVDLWSRLSGCGSVANGYISASSGNLAQQILGYA